MQRYLDNLLIWWGLKSPNYEEFEKSLQDLPGFGFFT
jgi:hypothetical protein